MTVSRAPGPTPSRTRRVTLADTGWRWQTVTSLRPLASVFESAVLSGGGQSGLVLGDTLGRTPGAFGFIVRFVPVMHRDCQWHHKGEETLLLHLLMLLYYST